MLLDQDEIHRLSLSEERNDRLEAIKQLEYQFKYFHDKSAAWIDLVRLTNDENQYLRWRAVYALGSVFPFLLVKSKYSAWIDLHRLTTDKSSFIRLSSVVAIDCAFCFFPDEYKFAAWADLVQLTSDKDSDVTWRAAVALESTFSDLPDESKPAAWADLVRLTNDSDSYVKWKAVDSRISAFSSVPDDYKLIAWEDLVSLTSDKDKHVKWRATSALGSAFSDLPEKFKFTAWTDIIRLANDTDLDVKMHAISVLGFAFKSLPGEFKSAAWVDLDLLINNKNPDVRWRTVVVLCSFFNSLPNELQSAAWADLFKLTSDETCIVRMHANHCLGKICIHNASKSENEDAAKELVENAIFYFEKATNEKEFSNPSKFCTLFYRSFDAVLFKKTQSKKEIEDYIASAKKEIGDSKTKKNLIEAVEQLAKVLEIAHSAQPSSTDWREMLKHCSDICNYVDQLMDESKAPAVREIFKKTRPSFTKTIKELITEIKEQAKAACREAKGTPAEAVVCSISKEIQQWRVENQIQMEKNLDFLLLSLKTQIPDIPENKFIYAKIDEIKSCSRVEDQIAMLAMIIPLIPAMAIPRKLDDIEKVMDKRFDDIKGQLNQMQSTLEQKLNQNYDELYSLSLELKSCKMDMESEHVKTFTAEIKDLIAKRDSETLELFVEKLISKEALLLDKVEKSKIKDNDKTERKKGIVKLRELPKIIKEKTSSLGKDVSKEIVVSVVAEQVILYILPVLTTAILGVPIPNEVINILLSVKNSD